MHGCIVRAWLHCSCMAELFMHGCIVPGHSLLRLRASVLYIVYRMVVATWLTIPSLYVLARTYGNKQCYFKTREQRCYQSTTLSFIHKFRKISNWSKYAEQWRQHGWTVVWLVSGIIKCSISCRLQKLKILAHWLDLTALFWAAVFLLEYAFIIDQDLTSITKYLVSNRSSLSSVGYILLYNEPEDLNLGINTLQTQVLLVQLIIP